MKSVKPVDPGEMIRQKQKGMYRGRPGVNCDTPKIAPDLGRLRLHETQVIGTCKLLAAGVRIWHPHPATLPRHLLAAFTFGWGERRPW